MNITNLRGLVLMHVSLEHPYKEYSRIIFVVSGDGIHVIGRALKLSHD